ncbi:hypothetical protein [Klebsiella sp. BIGb0407]|uniref:hypothetical protein n=1 Tax=Klebsiella sp. BIGb0407 TaxID=2940603 RepID=UPI002168AF06|nr:hypothetical protein [Klebsiella sp. BIGb0407]MCS3429579.1 hypothetical protein [Klebsiella sp. BIGb0407]
MKVDSQSNKKKNYAPVKYNSGFVIAFGIYRHERAPFECELPILAQEMRDKSYAIGESVIFCSPASAFLGTSLWLTASTLQRFLLL